MADTDARDSDATDASTPSPSPIDPNSSDETFHPRRAGEILRGLWTDRSATAKDGPVSDSDVKALVTGLTQKEITLSGLGAGLLVALSVATYLADRHSAELTKREVAPLVIFVGIGLGLVMLAGIIFKRRSVLGFASLMAGLEMTSWIGIIGVLYLVLGGWIIMRWTNLQRQKQDAKRARTNATKQKKVATSKAPARPTASKRYTPPRRRVSKGSK